MEQKPSRHARRGSAAEYRFPVSAIVSIAFALCWPVAAQAPLVSPSTLVLNSDQRGGIVVVGVADDSPTAFQVVDAFFVQDGLGQLREVGVRDAPFSAAGFLRAGPRKFSLAPGEGMQLRIAARPPKDLPAGEYRLHLKIESLGEQPDVSTKQALNQTLEITVPIRVALAVRILYRHLIEPEGGRIKDLTVRHGGEFTDLEFHIERLGRTSLLAEYQIFGRQADGELSPISKVKGANIYSELEGRRFTERLKSAQVAEMRELCIRLTPKEPGNPNLKSHEFCVV